MTQDPYTNENPCNCGNCAKYSTKPHPIYTDDLHYCEDRRIDQRTKDATRINGCMNFPGVLVIECTEDEKAYIELMMRRTGQNLKDYIMGNLEWDEGPYCIKDDREPSTDTCDGCDYDEKCPDVVRE